MKRYGKYVKGYFCQTRKNQKGSEEIGDNQKDKQNNAELNQVLLKQLPVNIKSLYFAAC